MFNNVCNKLLLKFFIISIFIFFGNTFESFSLIEKNTEKNIPVEIKTSIISKENKSNYYSDVISSGVWEPIQDKLIIKEKIKSGRKIKVLWSRDDLNGHQWESSWYDISQPAPWWYSFPEGEHTVSAKINDGYTEEIIQCKIVVSSKHKNTLDEDTLSDISFEENKLNYYLEEITLGIWEPLNEKLIIKSNSGSKMKTKVLWSQDSLEEHRWESSWQDISQPAPGWYSWEEGEYTVSAKIKDGYAEAIIQCKIVVLPPLKNIYLTFDDGPNKSTPYILDILDKYNYKATFFVLKYQMDQNPLVTKRIIDSGHRIGVHGVTHRIKYVYANQWSYLGEMERTNDSLEKICDRRTKLTRAPYGSVPYMTKNQLYRITSKGYKLWDWNVDSGDTSAKNPKTSTIVRKTIQQIKNVKTPIVLFHDKQPTVGALPEILEYIKQNKYTPQVLSENLKAQNFIEKTIKR